MKKIFSQHQKIFLTAIKNFPYNYQKFSAQLLKIFLITIKKNFLCNEKKITKIKNKKRGW